MTAVGAITFTIAELQVLLAAVDNLKDEEEDAARHRALLRARLKLEAALRAVQR
jgi:1,4-dihydroxy-2-naphthoate octaprenyltransferase